MQNCSTCIFWKNVQQHPIYDFRIGECLETPLETVFMTVDQMAVPTNEVKIVTGEKFGCPRHLAEFNIPA